jgi:hypothetical protein
MCVMSMVHDHFEPIIPGFPGPGTPVQPLVPQQPLTPWPQSNLFDILATIGQIAQLKDLIDRFEKAVAAAEVVDRLTAQPDCVDPEKAKLVERVAYWKARAEAAEKALGV